MAIQKIRETLRLDYDQIGFISNKENKFYLQMSGDELCVNAIASAAYLVSQDINSESIVIRSCNKDFVANVSGNNVTLKFDIDISIENVEEVTIVDLQGISFFVCKVEEFTCSDFILENKMRTYIASQNSKPAFGMLPYKAISQDGHFEIKPLINVSNTDIFTFESSCGSGSISCAIREFLDNGQTHFSIHQPSGGVIELELIQLENSNFNINFRTSVDIIDQGIL